MTYCTIRFEKTARKMRKTLSIAFDLDGTLVDTAPDLVRVLNEVIAPQGVPALPLEVGRNLIGYGSLALIKNAYAQAGISLEAQKALDLQKQFLARYAETLTQLSKPYPGVRDVLAQLKRGGARLSVCTNKPGGLARPLLRDLGLDLFFERIIGSDDTSAPKPAAQHIFTAVGHRNGGDIIMVGDGKPDVLAAKAVPCPAIIMNYGYSPQSMYSLGADKVLRNFRELPDAIAGLR